ncbi:MAG: MarR family winged helix-turn-helix transcriptional regulator [Candidatus Acidiferrales bacterium]
MTAVKRKNRATPQASPPVAESATSTSSSPSSPAARAEALPAREAVLSTQSRAAALAPLAPLSTMDIADQLHSAAIQLLRRLRVRDRESGIGPAQLSALSVLVFGGPRSLGELAEAEQVRPPTMSRIVAGLQSSRLIRRHGTEDGRRIKLSATAKGAKILWKGRERRVETLAKALAALTENETQQLRQAITLLQQVIRVL